MTEYIDLASLKDKIVEAFVEENTCSKDECYASYELRMQYFYLDNIVNDFEKVIDDLKFIYHQTIHDNSIFSSQSSMFCLKNVRLYRTKVDVIGVVLEIGSAD